MIRFPLLCLLAMIAAPALAWQAPDAPLALAERQARAQRDAQAAIALALMYEKGRDVPADPAEALRWREHAAALGDAAAQFDLAVRYEHGWGAPKDAQAAQYWFARAADGGNPQARRALERSQLRAQGQASDAQRQAPTAAGDAAARAESASTARVGAPEPRIVSVEPVARPSHEPADGREIERRDDLEFEGSAGRDALESDRHRREPRYPDVSIGWGVSSGWNDWGWSVWDGHPFAVYGPRWRVLYWAGWHPFGWYDWRWDRPPRHGHRHHRPRSRVHFGIGFHR